MINQYQGEEYISYDSRIVWIYPRVYLARFVTESWLTGRLDLSATALRGLNFEIVHQVRRILGIEEVWNSTRLRFSLFVLEMSRDTHDSRRGIAVVRSNSAAFCNAKVGFVSTVHFRLKWPVARIAVRE